MAITFDEQVTWDASILYIWANQGSERIRCRAGRETINELSGYTHASMSDIGKNKIAIANLLKPSFERKIAAGAFDQGGIKSVTVSRTEIVGNK
jgi:hypothetical protein